MSDVLKILLACALVVLLAAIGFAYVRSSANYELAADTTDQGGGKAASAGYTIQPGAAGQSTPTGTSGSTNYLLKGGYVYIESSGDSQGPTVEVTSPIGGELWKGGSTHNITFTATDESGLKANSLYAWYSTDGGGTFPNLITREAIITSPFVWNIPASINSQTVRVRLNLWDAYNNIGTAESPASFTIDSTPPTVTVIVPSGGQKWQGGIDHNLTWSATDNFTLEANPITLQYSTNSGTDYATIVTGEANDGVFNWPTPSLNTNEARVKILAQDICGNIGSGEGGNFVIDITPPTAPVLLTPPNGSTTNDATTTFTWNAATDNLSGITSYEVIIDTDVVTIDATTGYTTIDALAEGLHTWRVKAKDGAGWWGSYSDTWGFILDITTPEVLSSTLKDRLNGSTQYSRYLTISVEASGVTGVPVSMRMAQDLAFTQNATAWLAYSDRTEYTLTAGEGSRTVYYKVRDAASNESTPVNNSITVDTVSPTVESILLKDTSTGSTTESNSLTITVEAYGIQGSPTQMRIAQDASFTTNSTGWITYVPTTEYTFTAGDGPRPAYYQVRDIASNESNVVTQTIGIDTGGPAAREVALKDRITGSTQYTNSLVVSVEVHDVTGSPTQMRIYQLGGYNTGWFTYATTSEFNSFTAGEGSRTLYVVMRDSAENESPTYGPTIILDTQPPSQVSLLTPANNSYTNDTTPTMTWNAATDVTSGVASYEVVIDLTQITTLGAVTTFTTADAESQGWHNWKARAKDRAQNWGDYSTTWNLTIETTNPTVTLGKPRGGQTLEATGSYNITWEAADDFGLKTNPVTLYFSSNAGSSWSTIQAGIAYVTGEGTYSWTIPDVNSSQCRVSVEVEDKAGNKASNMSPTNFTISNVQPTAVVLYPNGGEYLKGNTSYNITWAATVEVEPATINLRYSTNGGTSWTLIASNESNDGTYAWTTPSVDSTTCRVSIEAKDGLSRVATNQSNANFAIDSSNPGVTVVAPAGGERIAGGSSFNVQWTAIDPVGFPTNAITLRYSNVVRKMGGLAKMMDCGLPTMTDSGGFQVFSLGVGLEKPGVKFLKEEKSNLKNNISNLNDDEPRPRLNKITEEGVEFQSHIDGSAYKLTPELSIQIQKKLGADLIIAFDDLESPTYSLEETKKSLELTNKWEMRSLKTHLGTKGEALRGWQLLYGVTHGGQFENLRRESARFVNKNFDAIALGGAHASKKNLYEVIDWTVSELDEEKLRHLLGIGEVEDIFVGVERGIDTFDCVIPTRLGRMGHVFVSPPLGYQKNRFRFDITKTKFAQDLKPIDPKCDCYVCRSYPRAYINHLFRAHELLAYTLASYHNVYFMVNLTNRIREAIIDGRFEKLKKEWI